MYNGVYAQLYRLHIVNLGYVWFNTCISTFNMMYDSHVLPRLTPLIHSRLISKTSQSPRSLCAHHGCQQAQLAKPWGCKECFEATGHEGEGQGKGGKWQVIVADVHVTSFVAACAPPLPTLGRDCDSPAIICSILIVEDTPTQQLIQFMEFPNQINTNSVTVRWCSPHQFHIHWIYKHVLTQQLDVNLRHKLRLI